MRLEAKIYISSPNVYRPLIGVNRVMKTARYPQSCYTCYIILREA